MMASRAVRRGQKGVLTSHRGFHLGLAVGTGPARIWGVTPSLGEQIIAWATRSPNCGQHGMDVGKERMVPWDLSDHTNLPLRAEF